MNILVIGLGSMGNRRLRCLKYINNKFKLYGYDLDIKRVNNAKNIHGINVYDKYENYFNNNIDLIIISTPPDKHEFYILDAINRKIKFFVEAGVFNDTTKKIQSLLLKNNVIGMPSSTLIHHPAIIKIKNIIKNNKLGSISNIIYHSGQYLPDWHTYEHVKDYYVSNKDTGGAREIVPFELTWMVQVFGFPNYVFGNNKKTILIDGAENIDDTYNIILEYDNFSINLIVDVVSRFATRNLTVNGSDAQLIWAWENDEIIIRNNDNIEKISYEKLDADDNYNANISEEMYINEMQSLIKYNKDYKSNVINNFYLDDLLIDILNKTESSNNNKRYERFINCGILINISLESKRLKKKHLQLINDKNILEYLLIRIKNKIDNLDNIKIILNISEKSRDNNYEILKELCSKYEIKFFFGNHSNIPQRINDCANFYGLTHIISVDGDDILCSSDTMVNIFNEFNKNSNLKYIYSNNLPFGMNVFGFSKLYLEKCLYKEVKSYSVGWPDIFDDKDKYCLKSNYDNIINFEKLRFTLDYEIDLIFFENILKNIDSTESDEIIINYVNENKIYEINEYIISEYWNNFYKDKNN